jgi:hypothetical protein
MQTTFECCGLSDPRDWILSSLNALPLSCCNTDKYKAECEAKVGLKIKLGSSLHRVRRDIYPLLWNQSCIHKIQDLVAGRKVLWTSLPLLILLFEICIMAFTSYLTDIIRDYTDYVADATYRANLLNPELVKLKAKQMKYHLIPESEEASVELTPSRGLDE